MKKGSCMIGIIGAMPRETDHLIRQIHDADEAVLCGIRYVRGILQGVPVVAAQCGIGKVYAALCAALMIEPDDVFFFLGAVSGGLLLPRSGSSSDAA